MTVLSQPAIAAVSRDPSDQTSALQAMADELEALAASMHTLESEHADSLQGIAETHRVSARNLLHYLAMRRTDLRTLQPALAALGLSSLGRAEGHALYAVRATLRAINGLLAMGGRTGIADVPCDMLSGAEKLAEHTLAVFGAQPPDRSAHIMVTMGSDAAEDYSIVHRLLENGMSCMRINCAHDGPGQWLKMIEHLRQARTALSKPCTILMDLAGPKLRTGSIVPGPAALKIKPVRDACGRVIAPARVWLTGQHSRAASPATADATLHVRKRWLDARKPGDRIWLRDLRGRRRVIRIVERDAGGLWGELRRTAYLTNGTRLEHVRPDQRRISTSTVTGIPRLPGVISLQAGDLLRLTRDQSAGCSAMFDSSGRLLSPARVSCSLPQVFADVKAGAPVCLDDGRVVAIVEASSESELCLKVLRTPPRGARLKNDRGINLPESELHLPAITDKDREDLKFIVQHADIVGLSFANNEADVLDLIALLATYGSRAPAIILKIETQRGFRHLPAMLLAAMHHPRFGVMIARGDLAVECGYERLAEVQEEILWLCEAAHCPAVWATQVLENLAKQGIPSRAEITDAAMGNRAECVMLNKGPHIDETLRVLGDILKRMDTHQDKKSAVLRALQLAIDYG